MSNRKKYYAWIMIVMALGSCNKAPDLGIFEGNGDALKSSGGTFKLRFTEPFYVGLGVCAHYNDTKESAIFSNVRIESHDTSPDSLKKIESTLETISIASTVTFS